MYKQQYVWLLLFAFGYCSHLNTFFQICKMSDKECLKNSIEEGVPKLAKDFEKISISSIDPISITEVIIQPELGPVSMYQKYTNILLYKTSYLKVINTKISLDPCNIQIKITWPQILLVAEYILKGTFLTFQLNSQDKLNATFDNPIIEINCKCEVFKENNEDYLRIVETQLTIDWGNLTINVGEIIKGNDDFNKSFNDIVNENPAVILNIVQKPSQLVLVVNAETSKPSSNTDLAKRIIVSNKEKFNPESPSSLGCSSWNKERNGEARSTTFLISPEQILPIPHGNTNKTRKFRKRGKTAILTESPYKNELQEQQYSGCFIELQTFSKLNMEVKCKPRSRNFTEFEKNLLFEIVTNNYIDIIENKKTDGVSCAKKQVAWEKISVKFNSQAQTGPRTAKQLHSLYDILKKNARSNLHSDKRNLYKTGGGTFTPKSSILDEKIVALLKPQFQPLVNNSDSSQEYYANTNYEFNDQTEYIVEDPCTSGLKDKKCNNSKHPTRITATSKSNVEETPKVPQTPRKRALPSTNTSTQNITKKKKSFDVIANRICSRKNLKDEIDQEVKNVKLQILNTDLKIKEKELEAVNEKIKQQRQLFESVELIVKPGFSNTSHIGIF
ncbi:hypothetical protein RN001_001744 [Aquatica leii]|uniref:Regulatory protein zeste n=1 Tax=Aquatica leii TaxID=1421715 RepID=A0AAN7PGJ5_9COLE|nr:hypothetical protein RN001_001744 [Aquatica leii]